ncbi:MAG: glycosyltransferase family 4 protein [Chlorobi bacterium]|nr:glycosyltransferase family 4 protein [Chlorobiota bacterium]
MKILLINNGYPTTKNPQYSTYIQTIQECLQGAALDVELLVLDTNFDSKKGKIIKYLFFYLKLLLHRYKTYDFVYIHNYPYVFIPLMFRFFSMRNIVIHWHGTDIFAPTKNSLWLNRMSYLFIPSKAQHIAPSEYFAGKVSRKLKINKNRIFVSPSGGVDTNLFAPSEKLNSDKVILGFASSMKSDKGMDFVLKLVQRTAEVEKLCGKRIEIHCIEYGAEKEYYKNELLKYGNVKVYKPFPKDEMIRFYQGLDVLLLTTRMAESLALVGLEAMSCNVPVVGTDDFAIRDYIINSVSGEKFKKGDYNDFENAVIKAIKNLNKYKPRKIVLEKYSKESVISQYKAYFKFNDKK